MLNITGLAHKYQVDPLLAKCKSVLEDLLDDCYEKAGAGYNLKQLPYLLICFKILNIALLYDFTEICTKGKNVISKFPCLYFIITREGFSNAVKQKWIDQDRYNRLRNQSEFNVDKEFDAVFKQQDACVNLFRSLPWEIQRFILVKRLVLCDDQTRK